MTRDESVPRNGLDGSKDHLLGNFPDNNLATIEIANGRTRSRGLRGTGRVGTLHSSSCAPHTRTGAIGQPALESSDVVAVDSFRARQAKKVEK